MKKSGEFSPIVFFEAIPSEELKSNFKNDPHSGGKFSLIIDNFGVLAYSAYPSAILQRYINLLKEKEDKEDKELQGKIFFEYGTENFRSTEDPSFLIDVSVYQTKVKKADGTTVTFPQWLESIPGLSVKKSDYAIEGTISPGKEGWVYLRSAEIKVKDKSILHIPTLKLIHKGVGKNSQFDRIFEEQNNDDGKLKVE